MNNLKGKEGISYSEFGFMIVLALIAISSISRINNLNLPVIFIKQVY